MYKSSRFCVGAGHVQEQPPDVWNSDEERNNKYQIKEHHSTINRLPDRFLVELLRGLPDCPASAEHIVNQLGGYMVKAHNQAKGSMSKMTPQQKAQLLYGGSLRIVWVYMVFEHIDLNAFNRCLT